MTEIATLRQRLNEAEEAYHKLAMGQSVVMLNYSIDGSNQRQFNQASLPALETYIARLKVEISRASGLGRRPFSWV